MPRRTLAERLQDAGRELAACQQRGAAPGDQEVKDATRRLTRLLDLADNAMDLPDVSRGAGAGVLGGRARRRNQEPHLQACLGDALGGVQPLIL